MLFSLSKSSGFRVIYDGITDLSVSENNLEVLKSRDKEMIWKISFPEVLDASIIWDFIKSIGLDKKNTVICESSGYMHILSKIPFEFKNAVGKAYNFFKMKRSSVSNTTLPDLTVDDFLINFIPVAKNSKQNVKLDTQRIIEYAKQDLEEIISLTTQNALNFFNIK